MADGIRIADRADYLAFELSGEFNEQDTARLLRAIVLVCADEGPKKVLMDVRAVTGPPPNIHSYSMAKVASELLTKWVRLALLCTKDQIAGTFFETIAFNRGVVVKAFDEPQSAIQWLRQQAPSPADGTDAAAEDEAPT